ncbi:DUF4781 domain-containing protein [Mesorhizobium sp.]|uniref:DUF4781 domain-containing protein n=1 Tax=Mesorhizobium sp. TaxID=1871066 RepID=UPI001211E557|nr:DUF4781 domain-containing protein [Mesorhizobium sp.]TIO33268.1 MAG: DUF4781 domain-containing protein [Mesorhizobium sp.]
MVRPITLKPSNPPNPPQKVASKTNADRTSRLQNEAAKLQEQIRLANKMGERDWAAQARQRLSQVNSELSSLQTPPITTTAAPAGPRVNGTTGSLFGNGTTTPALFTTPVTFNATNGTQLVTLDGATGQNPQTTANGIVKDITDGKSIDNIAADRGMTRDDVLAALKAGGMTVSTTDPTSDNGDVRTTRITDGSGKTVTEYYDLQHGNYHAQVTGPGGTETTTPLRDGLGRKQTNSYNPDTGAITTRYEDDLGSGTVTTRTSRPNGATVETTAPGAGPALPVTVVTSPDGRKTTLAAKQDPGGDSTKAIKDGLAAGKSLEQIATEQGLTREQVVAELEASGLQVKSTDPKSDNGDIQTVETVDPHTGDKVTYRNDYQHDVQTVVTVVDGKETSHSVDGFGGTRHSVKNIKTGESTTTIVDPKANTEVKIVVDKEGRTTTTTTEKLNNGTRETVKVTFNGYTLTTHPDGNMTLHDDKLGTDLKLKAGSRNAALAETLMSVNPNSSDPARAREGQVVKTFVEGVFAGEALPGLLAAAKQKGVDKQQLIDKYGLGVVASPTRDENNKVIDPFGNPPQGNAPSGGKWIPIKVDGVYRWVDPEVGKAIIAENTALSRVTEAQARATQKQAQTDVYLLDPAYKDAVGGARTVINKALAPHDLIWVPEKPKGTLAEANARLTKANTLLENATNARIEYESAESGLADAIAKNAQLKPLSDPNAPAAYPADGPRVDRHAEYAQGLADHASVKSLFADIGLHMSKGDKFTVDYMVGQAEFLGVSPDSEEFKKLKAMQEAADSQVELAEAYQTFYSAHANAADINAQATSLENQLLVEYNKKNQHLFEPDKKHSTYGGDYLGKFVRQEIKYHEDGQISVINHFEEGTTEQKLTVNLSDKNTTEEYRDRALNRQWQELLGCGSDGLQGARMAEAQAGKDLNTVFSDQLGNGLEDLTAQLKTLQADYDKALTDFGPGSVAPPKGTLPEGVEPVEITIGGQTIKVAPDVAAEVEKNGIDALTQAGKAVWIDLDPGDSSQGRWVDPRLAVARIKLVDTRNQFDNTEDLRRQVDGFVSWHDLRTREPGLLYDRNNYSDKAYLDRHQQETLDGLFQPQFQSLLENGFDNQFRPLDADALDRDVTTALHLDTSTEQDRDILADVTDEIREIGGDNAQVRKVRLYYVSDGAPTEEVTLFAVKNGDGVRYVDRTGRAFDNLGDFQDNNIQFSEHGKLVAPKGLEMKAGDDGNVALEVVKARNVSVMDRVVDPVIGIGTGLATLASFTPLAPVAAPLAYGGAAYLGTRAVIRQVNHLNHGGEWDDTESVMNVASVVTTVLPTASSAFRTFGMARTTSMTWTQAFRGSIGATKANSTLAQQTQTYMQSTAALNKAAWGMDVGAMIVGAPLLVASGYDLAANGDQMTGLELANAITGLGTGIAGTGLGIRGLRHLRPGSGGQTPASPNAAVPPNAAIPHAPNQPPSPPLAGGPKGANPPAAPIVVNAAGPNVPVGRQGGQQPIVVPTALGGNSGLRLVWDPATKTFSGTPERNPGEYTYTSGKDPRTRSAYLDGLTPEQLLARYQRESGYYSAREMAERYGPDGLQLPAKSLKDGLPDFRVGVTFRVRLNTGQFAGIGSPTISAVGFGIGTKTDFGVIGWSILDSFSQKSMAPLKDALSTQGVVSFRAREYLNITGLQAGVWPVSNQTAFPVRAKDLAKVAQEALFTDKAGYDARVRDVRVAGKTPDEDGAATVIELGYTPSLKGEEVSLAPGEHDFFGVPAESNGGHVRLQGTLPFDRVMTEFKAGLRLPVLANHIDTVDQLPRAGFEKRPESPVKDTLKAGDVVSKQAFDQIEAALGSTTLHVRFTVKDPAKAADLVAALKMGDVDAIRALVAAGEIDPAKTVSFVENPITSGFRLSAVPGKTPSKDINLLTGETVRMGNPDAMLIDVIFNDNNRLPGVLGFNPDKMTTSASYKVKGKVQSWLPEGMQPNRPPQSRSMPTDGNIYQGLYGSYGTPATRYTASLSTPPLPSGPFAYSAEVRVQFKSSAPKAPSSIAKGKNAVLTFDGVDGKPVEITVPAWLAHALGETPAGAATVVPKGGKASLDKFLGDLEKQARPDQARAIAQFRKDFGDVIADGKFLRSDAADAVVTFLSLQVGRRGSGPIRIRDENGEWITATRLGSVPRNADSVYVPPAGGPPARGDEPNLTHKSHKLVRDPDTGEAFVLPWIRGASDEHVPGSLPKSASQHGPDPAASPKPAPDAKALKQMSGEDMATLAEAQLQGMAPALFGRLSVEQVGGFTPEQIGWLSAQQLAAMKPKQLRALTPVQLQAIKPELLNAIPAGRITQFSLKQVAALSPEQLAALTVAQTKKLTPAQLAGLSSEQFNAFTAEQFKALRPAQIAGLKPEQIGSLKKEHLEAFSPEQFAALTTKQLAALSGEQFALFKPELIGSLSTEQLSILTADQFNSLTKEQLGAIKPGRLGKVSTDQLAAFKPETIAALSPETIASLTPQQIAALTGSQLGALTVQQVGRLTSRQIAALTPDQLRSMSPGQLRKFAPDQLLGMTSEQLGALSLLQLTTFRATHKKQLTAEQAAELKQLIKTARKQELKQVLLTFGVMAGVSTAMWTTLPRGWALTIGGVAFSVRGTVFTLQSFFPNATGMNTRFGRTLNTIGGLTFSAAAPGALLPSMEGTNLGVNGTYSVGNLIYGTKTSLQVATQRPVLRNAAEHVAGPAYIAGSAVYMWQSIKTGDPVDITAGAMFTFGCAEFWVSALRTDFRNRKPVPITDQQVAAAAKSDARWAMADRVTLGVTFGIGMFLFSWSALRSEPWNNAAPASDPDEDIDPADTVAPPVDEVPGKPEPEPEKPAKPYPQLVVLADDGLNVRAGPGQQADVITVLEPGTLAQQTGGPSNANDGAWLPIEGYGVDEKLHDGWVAAEYVEPHPQGSRNAHGRTNPALEAQGYRWVDARPGQSIGLIARSRSADVAKTVALNMDHIRRPEAIFEGDRIYLPA